MLFDMLWNLKNQFQVNFSAKQVKLLQQLLNQTTLFQGFGYISSSILYSWCCSAKNNIIFLLSHTVSKDNWIVDTGALDHLTGLPMFLPRMRRVLMVWMFQLLMVLHLMFPVLAMLIFLGWLLTSVLHVLSFPSSLLYVSKLTKDLNCAVTFFPSHYEFEDLTLGRMIGSAEKGTAYIISVVLVPLCQRSLPNVSFSVVSEFDVMLWHKRLGHPSFIYLKTLYPHLVIIKDFSLWTLYLC